MAEGVDAGELWLPSQFLADNFFPSRDTWAAKGGDGKYGPGFISCEEFPLEVDSNLGSPVEHATDAESDEEDYLAELTRQMAHAFLKENDDDDDDDDDDSSLLPQDYPKGMAGSPQSTLCDLGAWSGSGKGSPNGASQVSSPTSTPSEQNKDDTWDDLLNAAAGEVVRLRLNDHQAQQQQQQQQQQRVQGRGLLGTPAPAKHSLSTPAPCNNSTTSTVYFSAPILTQQQQQLQAERFYQLKQQQVNKQQQAAAPWGRQQNRAKVGASGVRPLGLPSSAWPPLQTQPQHQHQNQHQLSQPGSGMRALFLTGSGNRRESSGTGVFLPRRPGNPSDHRKKPACSTVLLPDRVVQALNLNLDDMDCHPRLPGGYLLDHDAMVARGAQQKWNHYRPPPAATSSHELRLPAEWTY